MNAARVNICRHKITKRASRTGLLIVALFATGTGIAQEVDPEWPCVQRLILEVSPAVMWPVPVEEGTATAYRQDAQLRALAEQLGDIETFTDAHRQSIAEYANSLPDAQREEKLTLLASGVVDVSNRIRKDYISGIKRYTRQQIAIAGQIENTLNELSLLEDGNISAAGQSRQEIEETLRWHERVYDQRERVMQLLCEEPVELEELLSEVLRETAQYLP